jgi:hypothetical protein
MKATRLLALAMASMLGSIGTAAVDVMRRAAAPRAPKTFALSRTVGSSRNGGRRGSNRAAQRTATKRRNVMRHRAACRG